MNELSNYKMHTEYMKGGDNTVCCTGVPSLFWLPLLQAMQILGVGPHVAKSEAIPRQNVAACSHNAWRTI